VDSQNAVYLIAGRTVSLPTLELFAVEPQFDEILHFYYSLMKASPVLLHELVLSIRHGRRSSVGLWLTFCPWLCGDGRSRQGADEFCHQARTVLTVRVRDMKLVNRFLLAWK